jgi:hypothetical protein
MEEMGSGFYGGIVGNVLTWSADPPTGNGAGSISSIAIPPKASGSAAIGML